MRRLLLAAALLGAFVLAVPALAEPGRVVKETFHEEFFNEIEAFCGTDMVVESHFVVDGTTTISRADAMGSSTSPIGSGSRKRSRTWTTTSSS